MLQKSRCKVIQIQQQKLLWNGVRRIPKFFSEEEINFLFKTLAENQNYWKGLPNARFKKGSKISEWGEFFKLRDVCIVATIYILGLRPKEACCLKFSDFDFKNMWVHISGKNNKCKKDRTIPVPKLLMKFFKPYLSLNKYRFWRGSEYLFPSFENDHISAKTVSGFVREKMLKPAGLWKKPDKGKVSEFRSYTFRHSRASHMLKKQIKEKGIADLHGIANWLGHSDLRSTTIYLHTDETYMNYLAKMGEI